VAAVTKESEELNLGDFVSQTARESGVAGFVREHDHRYAEREPGESRSEPDAANGKPHIEHDR
jgi:hypothetical protein